MSFGEPFQGHLRLTLQRGNKARWGRFSIPSSAFFNLIGKRLEHGKLYRIEGEIEGIGPFRLSHVERGALKVIISVRREQANELHYGSNYSICVTGITQQLTQNIIDAKGGPALKLSLRTLKAMGFTKDWRQGRKVILEFKLRKIGNVDLRARCFTSYSLGSHDLSLWVGRRGLIPGDVVEVESEEYGIEGFVRDFEAHRGEAFRNLQLSIRDGNLGVRIDGELFALDRPYLTTNALRVILHATIRGTSKEIRFQFDGERIQGCFFKDRPIISITILRRILMVSYGNGETRTFCFYLDKFGESDVKDRITVRPSSLGTLGVWDCAIDPELGRLVRSRLVATTGTGRWSRERGDISEVFLAHILALTGEWDEVVLHPQSWSPVRDSRRKGPDITARWRRTGRLYHFELKWWVRRTREAEFDARRQARAYLAVYPLHNGEAVAGAMIGILDWDEWATSARFYTKQVA